jgi:hypothetical protein
VSAVRKRSILSARRGEPRGELVSQVLRLDDRVHDEFPGEAHDVDVFLALRAEFFDETPRAPARPRSP